MNRSVFVKLWPLIGVALVFLFALSSCKSKKEATAEVPELKVLEIRGTTVPLYLEMVGKAEGIPTVEIRARVSGYLKNWTFKEGSVVQKGQTLFQIEPDEYANSVAYATADLDSRKAAWEKAKLDVARLKPLLATNAISQNDYDKAVTTEQQDRAAVASGEANLSNAKLNLSYTTIASPISGYIGACNVNPGNLVGKGDPTLLTTVSAMDPMYINFQISETDYLKIMRYIIEHKLTGTNTENSFKILLTLSDKKPYKYEGKIDFIDREVNPQTGTIAMRAVVPNPEGLIKPGTFSTVNLVLRETNDGVVIPQSTITEIQGRYFVFLVDKSNKVTRVPVMASRNLGQKVMILQGLKKGDRILMEGFQKFQEGLVIKPIVVQDTSKVSVLPQM
ncbi:MAG: efflux RND transporter periplasmic adaptor subunit [Syntrophothermus sp.]